MWPGRGVSLETMYIDYVHRCRVWMGGYLKTVDVNPGAGSESWGNSGDCGHGTSGTGSRWWGHPGDCGHVTQSAVSGEEADSGDCGCMTHVYGLGGDNCGYCRHLTPGIGPGRGVTMDTLAM